MLRFTLTFCGCRLLDVEMFAPDEDEPEVHELESTSFPFGFAAAEPADDADEEEPAEF